MTMQSTDALILKDASGDFYVLSADALGQARATDAQRAIILETIGEVAGYGIDSAYGVMSGPTAAFAKQKGDFQMVAVVPVTGLVRRPWSSFDGVR